MTDTENAQQFIALMRGLRQVRQFHTGQIPQEVLHDVLEVARWTGSAGNSQPWEFVVLRNRETLKALSQLEGVGQLAEADAAIVIVMPGDTERAEITSYDEGRVTERIMLAAAAHGVAASIGMFRGSGIEVARTLLGIPAHLLVRTSISLGYANVEALRSRPKQGRKPLSELVYEERYVPHN